MAHEEVRAGQVVVEDVQGGFEGGVEGEGGDLRGEWWVEGFVWGEGEGCGCEEVGGDFLVGLQRWGHGCGCGCGWVV